MPVVSRLMHSEVAQFDADRTTVLMAEFGEAGAERMIGRSLEDIAVRLNTVERAQREGNFEKARAAAREMALIADYAGFASLARVAKDAMRVIECGDPAARGAVLSRLVRVGESTLMPACDMRGMPI